MTLTREGWPSVNPCAAGTRVRQGTVVGDGDACRRDSGEQERRDEAHMPANTLRPGSHASQRLPSG